VKYVTYFLLEGRVYRGVELDLHEVWLIKGLMCLSFLVAGHCLFLEWVLGSSCGGGLRVFSFWGTFLYSCVCFLQVSVLAGCTSGTFLYSKLSLVPIVFFT
jgi:hypothetical protein